jgi:hypothetical protein
MGTWTAVVEERLPSSALIEKAETVPVWFSDGVHTSSWLASKTVAPAVTGVTALVVPAAR